MCNVKRYEAIYKELSTLTLEDFIQLSLESTTDEQGRFYDMVSDFFIREKQKIAIKENKF